MKVYTFTMGEVQQPFFERLCMCWFQHEVVYVCTMWAVCMIYTFTSAASYSIELLLSLFCNNRFRPRSKECPKGRLHTL